MIRNEAPDQSPNAVYFNTIVVNRSDRPKIASFDQTRSDTILPRADNYMMAPIRWEFPKTSLPIMSFDRNQYYVTIREAGVDKTLQVAYVDRGNPLSDGVRGIYTFQQFLIGLNASLASAYTSAPASTGNPARVILEISGKFTMQVDATFTGEIYFSTDLYRLFVGWDWTNLGFYRPDRKDALLNVAYDGINYLPYLAPDPAGNYLAIRQNTSSQFAFPDIQSIALNSTMPCERQQIGLTDNTAATDLSVISDYLPVQSSDRLYDTAPFTYAAGSGERFVDFVSPEPLRRLDYQVNLFRKDGSFQPLYILPGEAASVKFMFIKISLLKNFWPGGTHYDRETKLIDGLSEYLKTIDPMTIKKYTKTQYI